MLPIEQLTRQAGSPGRIVALNLKNTPCQDGVIRGSILPVGTKQSTINFTVAVVTLSAFVFWPYIMALLFLSSARPEREKQFCAQLQLRTFDVCPSFNAIRRRCAWLLALQRPHRR